MICRDHHPAKLELSSEELRLKFAPPPEQMELDFSSVISEPNSANKLKENKAQQQMTQVARKEALHGEF